MAETLWTASVMRQVPMLAAVVCGSRAKLIALPEALGPSSWLGSQALVTLYGSSGLALALQQQEWGITVSQSRLVIRGLMGGEPHAARRSEASETLQERQSSSLKGSSFVPA